jgi:hypothetical protein
MAFSRAGARTACRPRCGPGPGFYFPTWANLGLVITSRSFGIDDCTLLPTDENRHSRRNPSAHQFLSSLSLSVLCAAPQQLSDGRASDGMRTTAPPRAPRQRARGGRAAVEQLLSGLCSRACPHGFPSAQRKVASRDLPARCVDSSAAGVVVAEISTPR